MSGSTGPIPGSSQPTQEASQSNAAAKRARKAARKAALLSTPSQQPAATPLPALQPVPTSAKKERKAEKKRQRALVSSCLFSARRGLFCLRGGCTSRFVFLSEDRVLIEDACWSCSQTRLLLKLLRLQLQCNRLCPTFTSLARSASSSNKRARRPL